MFKSKEKQKSLQTRFDEITTEEFRREHSTVYITNKYETFSFIEENRPVRDAHLDNIRDSIAVKQLPVPIIVDEEYRICDGQHRFVACRELKKPIYYIQVPSMTIEDIQRLNADTRTWSVDDFLDSFCKRGRPEYLKYRDFKEKYGFGHSECLVLLSGWKRENKKKTINQNFKDGNFRVVDYGEAVSAADKINKIKKYFKQYKTRWFVAAMLRCFKKSEYEHNRFLKKLSSQSAKMMKQADTDSYLINIETIYNHNSSDKINLRF
jgi:hypothetical protein